MFFDTRRVEDQASLMCQMPNGAIANLWCSFAMNDPTNDPWSVLYKVLGTNGGFCYSWNEVQYEDNRGPAWGLPCYEDGFAGEAFSEFGRRFNRKAVPPPLPCESFDQANNEYIGYQIVGRNVVTTVLGAFCLVLLGSGLMLARANRLEHIGWFAALLAVATSAVLVSVGLANRGEVQNTFAATQLVYVVPTQNAAMISSA